MSRQAERGEFLLSQSQQCSENSSRITKRTELFTWVMLLDPADAVLVYLFGFLWQHAVLEVRSVEAHGESDDTSDKESPRQFLLEIGVQYK